MENGVHFLIFPMIVRQIDLSWEPGLYAPKDSAYDDRLNVFFYNETQNEALPVEEAGLRSADSYTAQLSLWNVGDIIHTWIFFNSRVGNMVSTSQYLGPVVLLA